MNTRCYEVTVTDAESGKQLFQTELEVNERTRPLGDWDKRDVLEAIGYEVEWDGDVRVSAILFTPEAE